MATAKQCKATAEDMLRLLRDRYPSTRGEYAFAAEVHDKTGARARRRCDAICISCWPSNGIAIHGFEIKVSRSDWIKEMQDHAKAEAFVDQCNYWWLVSPKDVAKIEEIPPTWGWLVSDGEKPLKVARAATKHSRDTITIDFVASIVRAVVERSATEKEIADARQKGYSEAVKASDANFEKRLEANTKVLKRQYDELQTTVSEFEKASGIRLHAYNGKGIGERVALVNNLRNPQWIADQVRTIETDLTKLYEVIGKLKQETP